MLRRNLYRCILSHIHVHTPPANNVSDPCFECDARSKTETQDQKLRPGVCQVAKLQSQLLQQQREGQGRSNGKADTKLTSQDAARELIADITSTLNVRSSRVLNSTSALSPRPEQNGHHRSFNLNAPTDDELGEVRTTGKTRNNCAAACS
jgi:hypothetical protein